MSGPETRTIEERREQKLLRLCLVELGDDYLALGDEEQICARAIIAQIPEAHIPDAREVVVAGVYGVIYGAQEPSRQPQHSL